MGLPVLALASTAVGDARDYRLIEIRHFAHGARVAWSPDGTHIAFDRRGDDDLYDLWVMNADGSEQRCLSCDHPDLPIDRQPKIAGSLLGCAGPNNDRVCASADLDEVFVRIDHERDQVRERRQKCGRAERQ